MNPKIKQEHLDFSHPIPSPTPLPPLPKPQSRSPNCGGKSEMEEAISRVVAEVEELRDNNHLSA